MKVTLLSPALSEIIEAIKHYEGQAVGLSASLEADLTTYWAAPKAGDTQESGPALYSKPS